MCECEHAHGACVVSFRRVLRRMEELFLHLWDEVDDIAGVCRHVATATASEMLAAVPLIAAVSAALLGGAATLLLSHRELLAPFT